MPKWRTTRSSSATMVSARWWAGVGRPSCRGRASASSSTDPSPALWRWHRSRSASAPATRSSLRYSTTERTIARVVENNPKSPPSTGIQGRLDRLTSYAIPEYFMGTPAFVDPKK
ncbi:hypothetical protein CEXT_120961 [Caerostris extrusa]|uniref:Uncharacterized protein n=1 Tax=Caerostris extrusa TaxID=172846 RepID=A0AAV4XS35_CAEEX|nr:hypothetical protein CEXT_120961 [Caerostris extrusa]